MNTTTNFSFELYYSATSTTDAVQREAVMRRLGPSLQALLAAKDGTAKVIVSDSHRGSDNKIVEVSTTLPDAGVAEILKQFCDVSGLTVNIVE